MNEVVNKVKETMQTMDVAEDRTKVHFMYGHYDLSESDAWESYRTR